MMENHHRVGKNAHTLRPQIGRLREKIEEDDQAIGQAAGEAAKYMLVAEMGMDQDLRSRHEVREMSEDRQGEARELRHRCDELRTQLERLMKEWEDVESH